METHAKRQDEHLSASFADTFEIKTDNKEISTQDLRQILPLPNLDQLKMLMESEDITSDKTWQDTDAQDSQHKELPNPKDVPRVVRVPHRAPPSTRYIRLQEWEGVVTRADGDAFEATLYDKTDTSNPPEQAEFTRDDLAWDEDMQLVAPGAIFDMSVGYEIKMIGYRPGQRQKVCRLRFRRLPGWTKRDIEEIDRKAAEFESVFKDNPDANDG